MVGQKILEELDFFKEKRLSSRRELAKYTVGTGAVAPRYCASEQQRTKAFYEENGGAENFGGVGFFQRKTP